MGYEAMQAFPSFLQTVNALDKVLQRVAKPEWSIREVLEASEDASHINEDEFHNQSAQLYRSLLSISLLLGVSSLKSQLAIRQRKLVQPMLPVDSQLQRL